MSESAKKRTVIGKADSRYWLQAGKLLTDPRSRFLSCKIQVSGRRESFPLRTSNKSAAAAKAAKIFGDVVTLGWEQAIAVHKPETIKKTTATTVGAWIEAVRTTADFRGTTFTIYAQCLRQIVSEMADIGDQPALDEEGNVKRDRKRRIILLSRFDYRSGGREAWRAKVDAQSLNMLTPEAVQRWRMAYVARAGNAPDAMRRAENSAVALIRNARGLFSSKALEFATKSISLPDPLPFAGLKLKKRGSTRYVSKIDAPALIAAAREELTGEPFKLFCLGLLCGLRKKEMDALLWSQVDFQSGQIHIEATKYFQPKSEDSIGAVDLDDELLALLRGWKAQAEQSARASDGNAPKRKGPPPLNCEGKPVRETGEFVVQSTRAPRHDLSRANYRCQCHFNALYDWLRKKGITARKPLHELRKELGALLASQDGIFAAQRVLRHAQIGTTASYYADKKERITAGLGALLTAKDNTIPLTVPAAAPKTTVARRKGKAGA